MSWDSISPFGPKVIIHPREFICASLMDVVSQDFYICIHLLVKMIMTSSDVWKLSQHSLAEISQEQIGHALRERDASSVSSCRRKWVDSSFFWLCYFCHDVACSSEEAFSLPVCLLLCNKGDITRGWELAETKLRIKLV